MNRSTWRGIAAGTATLTLGTGAYLVGTDRVVFENDNRIYMDQEVGSFDLPGPFTVFYDGSPIDPNDRAYASTEDPEPESARLVPDYEPNAELSSEQADFLVGSLGALGFVCPEDAITIMPIDLVAERTGNTTEATNEDLGLRICIDMAQVLLVDGVLVVPLGLEQRTGAGILELSEPVRTDKCQDWVHYYSTRINSFIVSTLVDGGFDVGASDKFGFAVRLSAYSQGPCDTDSKNSGVGTDPR